MSGSDVAFGFPFAVAPSGRVAVTGGDETIRGKIIQVLFTAPGERVNRPDFGCGLFNLVFEPNNEILAAAVEFTVGQALTRWLGDEIRRRRRRCRRRGRDAERSRSLSANKADLSRQAVHIQFR